MKTDSLKGLSAAGLCLLALVSAPRSQADEVATACPPQSCPSCPGYARTCRHDCCLETLAKWAFCSDYYVLPPDYGWNAPVKVPVVRQGVTYYRYWPEQWYGTGTPAPGAYRTYPMVYSPTDTTQLGYTYQQVPYWEPAPYRLPPPPVPAQWHVREPHYGYYGRWHSCYTPIHHHHARMGYWVEPMGGRPAPSAGLTQPAGPVVCPPSAEPSPVLAPKRLEPVPVPAAPAPAEEPAAPATPAEGKTAAKSKSRMTTMLPRFRSGS